MVNACIFIVLLSAVVFAAPAKDTKFKEADVSHEEDSDGSEEVSHFPRPRQSFSQGGVKTDSTMGVKGGQISYHPFSVKGDFGSPSGHVSLLGGHFSPISHPLGTHTHTDSFNPLGSLPSHVSSFNRPVGAHTDPESPISGLLHKYPVSSPSDGGSPYHPDSSFGAYYGSHNHPLYSANHRVDSLVHPDSSLNYADSPHHEDSPNDHVGYIVHPDSLLNGGVESFSDHVDSLDNRIGSIFHSESSPSGHVDPFNDGLNTYNIFPSTYLIDLTQPTSQHKITAIPTLIHNDFPHLPASNPRGISYFRSAPSNRSVSSNYSPSSQPRNTTPNESVNRPQMFPPRDNVNKVPEVTVLANLAYTYSLDPPRASPRDVSGYRPPQRAAKTLLLQPIPKASVKGIFNRPTNDIYSAPKTFPSGIKTAQSNVKRA